MNNLKTLERLKKLHERIERENTGSPIEIATYMNTSERSIYYLMDELRNLGAKINYNRTTKTYYYYNDFRIELNISLKVITEGKSTNIYG